MRFASPGGPSIPTAASLAAFESPSHIATAAARQASESDRRTPSAKAPTRGPMNGPSNHALATRGQVAAPFRRRGRVQPARGRAASSSARPSPPVQQPSEFESLLQKRTGETDSPRQRRLGDGIRPQRRANRRSLRLRRGRLARWGRIVRMPVAAFPVVGCPTHLSQNCRTGSLPARSFRRRGKTVHAKRALLRCQ